MKRISWSLGKYVLPNFVFYDKENKVEGTQVPMSGTLPMNESYFIGTSGNKELLCYHISEGKYIVVSYNFNSAVMMKEIIASGIMDMNVIPPTTFALQESPVQPKVVRLIRPEDLTQEVE